VAAFPRGAATDDISPLLRTTVTELGQFVNECMTRARSGCPSTGSDYIWRQLAEQWNGWPSNSLFQAVGKYIEYPKSDALDPLAWWREHGRDLAPLDSVARWFLCIPATSAESERTFSLAGWLVSSVRARMSGSRVNDLVLLQRRMTSGNARRMRRAQGVSTSLDVEGIAPGESDDVEVVDEGDQMAELVDEGTFVVNADGVLVPTCDPMLLDATGSEDGCDCD
jgi:hypothetical protein